jgi:hypothetical protein
MDPRAFYLAKVYNTTGSYWEETHATITTDGSRVIWATNWGQNVGQEEIFLMQLDMPPNWRELTTSYHRADPVDGYGFNFMQNYPNPFNFLTTARYSIPRSSHVEIAVYNIKGQLVATLVSEEQDEGFHSVDWNAADVFSGVYFFRFTAGEFHQMRKCVLLK